MAPEPTDCRMYNRIKKQVMDENRTHSAYRSGMIVQRYKKEFAKKYGDKAPYNGEKNQRTGLARWFDEKWSRDTNGSVGYTRVGQVYRPQIRITDKTPKTWSELSEKEIKRAKQEKKKTGRVKKFL